MNLFGKMVKSCLAMWNLFSDHCRSEQTTRCGSESYYWGTNVQLEYITQRNAYVNAYDLGVHH